MNRSVVTAALLAFVIAGCSSGGETPGDGDGETSRSSSGSQTTTGAGASGSASTTGTGAPGGQANQAPEARLGASTAGGTPPLQVNFTLNGTDADGDALQWTLDFGDNSTLANGTAFGQVAHDFTSAGTYNVTLNVTDGKAWDHASVVVNVTAAAAGAGQVAEMVWDIGLASAVGQTSGPPYLNCEDGPNRTFNYDSFTLDLATRGQPFKVGISALSGDSSIQSWRIFFNLEDCSAFAGGPFTATGAADITGIVPENASAYVFVMATGGFLLEASYQSGSMISA